MSTLIGGGNVQANGIRQHYLRYGGKGPVLLLVPGITSPAVTFDFVARELTDLVRPLVLDVRGRGLSDAGAGYTLEDYARDTEEVIRRLGLERPLLVGHSLGGMVALAVAIEHPQAISGLALLSPYTHHRDIAVPAFAPLFIASPWRRWLIAQTVACWRASNGRFASPE